MSVYPIEGVRVGAILIGLVPLFLVEIPFVLSSKIAYEDCLIGSYLHIIADHQKINLLRSFN